jgi:hypothetical protein
VGKAAARAELEWRIQQSLDHAQVVRVLQVLQTDELTLIVQASALRACARVRARGWLLVCVRARRLCVCCVREVRPRALTRTPTLAPTLPLAAGAPWCVCGGCCAQELVDGGSLDRFLEARKGQVPERDAASLLKQVRREAERARASPESPESPCRQQPAANGEGRNCVRVRSELVRAAPHAFEALPPAARAPCCCASTACALLPIGRGHVTSRCALRACLPCSAVLGMSCV